MGLPGENYDDIAGIAALAHNVVSEYYRTPDRNRRMQPSVTISVACFIPKPNTPFQWEGQSTLEELYEKQKFLAEQITDRKVKYNYHDAEVSRLEAVFARGIADFRRRLPKRTAAVSALTHGKSCSIMKSGAAYSKASGLICRSMRTARFPTTKYSRGI